MSAEPSTQAIERRPVSPDGRSLADWRTIAARRRAIGLPHDNSRALDTMQPERGPWWHSLLGPLIRRRNKAVVRGVLEAFNSGDEHAIERYEHPDFVDIINFPPGYDGIEGIKMSLKDLHAAFDDLYFEETSCIAEGDLVVLRHRMRGRHVAPLLGVPPTGRWMSFPGIDINRVRNGKIVEHLGSVDFLEFLDALGVLDAEMLENPAIRMLRAWTARELRCDAGPDSEGHPTLPAPGQPALPPPAKLRDAANDPSANGR
jgi:predicted ester cyclase